MKFTIFQQIDNAKRELAMRRQVYPGRVVSKKMTQSEADYLIGCQESTIKTLEWIAEHREELRLIHQRYLK